jgi:hypothetical protein
MRFRLHRTAAGVVTAGLALGLAALAPVPVAGADAPAARFPALPLGPVNLPQSVTVQQVTPGVTLTTIVRGRASATDFWYVRVGVFATEDAAQAQAAKVTAAGEQPEILRIDGRPVDDPQHGPAGFLVRAGHFATQDEATALSSRLQAAGLTGLAVTNSSIDHSPTNGPWQIRVLRVDRSFAGTVSDELSNGMVIDRETTSSLVNRIGAVAGVNGGYFVIGTADGTPGSAAGVSVLDGNVVREPNGRAALLLPGHPGDGARVDQLTGHMSIRSSDGATGTLNGVDRSVGVIRDCGEPGDVPFTITQQDVTCTNPDEIVAFDTTYGPSAEAGAGVAAITDGNGKVLQLQNTRGAAIPANGHVIEGIGNGAAWLQSHATPGRTLKITQSLSDAHGRPLPLTPHLDVVGGGPFLVKDGRTFVDAFTEGFEHPSDPSFFYAFAIARNPRTMAGVTSHGDLLLVTVDGRQPGYSVGLTFDEEAGLMKALGAADALNLDGGGSTSTVVNGTLLGRPSDATGERPIGDAIAIFAPQKGHGH